jgi:hypothetical protein
LGPKVQALPRDGDGVCMRRPVAVHLVQIVPVQPTKSSS